MWPDTCSTDTRRAPASSKRLPNELEDLEQRHSVEAPIVESELSGVHVRGREAGKALSNGLEIVSSLEVDVARHDLELGKCIEERPEKGSSPAPDVEPARAR